MDITEKLHDLIKTLPEKELSEVLDFAEFLKTKREREKAESWATLDRHTGRYDGAKWNRDDLYDRPGLR